VIRRGEIYEISLSAGRGPVQSGPRPALVVQNDTGNEFAATTIVAAMSTRASQAYAVRVHIPARRSGLRESSVVMLDQLFTVDQGQLKRRLGRISADAMAEVDDALKVSLGLD
jgi:mRNA interferase MazF